MPDVAPTNTTSVALDTNSSEVSSAQTSLPVEVSPAVLADTLSSMGTYLSVQFRAGITEESLGADNYKKAVFLFTKFDACYTDKSTALLARKKSILFSELTPMGYIETVLRDCYFDSCVDAYGRKAKGQCKDLARSTDSKDGSE